ncbi:MAG: Gfo/Idh/MocA family protein [Akkermansiaceae bacterium]
MLFTETSRRRFLNAASATFASTMVGLQGLGQLEGKTYRVGLVGCGWYGKSDILRLIQVADVEVTKICDPDQKMLAGAAEIISQRQKSGKRPETFSNHRQMLAGKDLDIVLIGSPDHWHALQMIDAVKAGAHVYVQKPISVDVMEGEAMVAAARKYDRVVQVGTQRKSTPHLVEAKKNIIDAGLLGEIGHVELCCYYHMRAEDNPPEQEVPAFFDYEEWTGPAPLRPYDGLPHRRWWRAFMEYGNGIMGDMCIHMLDTARWMLELGWPEKITSTGGIYVQTEAKSNTADTQSATFHYPEFTVNWQHRSWGKAPDPDYPWALFIYGSKGTLKASVHQYDFIPQGGKTIRKEAVFERGEYPEDMNEKDIELHAAPATRAHLRDFIAAIEEKERPVSDIEDGHISTASCILANLSMDLNRPLVYDPKKREVVGDPEATELLQRSYRKGYEHPHPERI